MTHVLPLTTSKGFKHGLNELKASRGRQPLCDSNAEFMLIVDRLLSDVDVAWSAHNDVLRIHGSLFNDA